MKTTYPKENVSCMWVIIKNLPKHQSPWKESKVGMGTKESSTVWFILHMTAKALVKTGEGQELGTSSELLTWAVGAQGLRS